MKTFALTLIAALMASPAFASTTVLDCGTLVQIVEKGGRLYARLSSGEFEVTRACDDTPNCTLGTAEYLTYESATSLGFVIDVRSSQFNTDGANGGYLIEANGAQAGMWCRGEDQKFLGDL